ncbi:hypothetical protein DFH06DRAFT_1326737 [Mycena polygramma]|nr:hypothetical protein DFH06DRAFT_1326737 [Mycena polygramma]
MSSQAVVTSVIGPHADPLSEWLKGWARIRQWEEESVLTAEEHRRRALWWEWNTSAPAVVVPSSQADPLLDQRCLTPTPTPYLTTTFTLSLTLKRGERYANFEASFSFLLPKFHAAEHYLYPVLLTYDYACLVSCDANFTSRRRLLADGGIEHPLALSRYALRMQQVHYIRHTSIRGPHEFDRAWNLLLALKRSHRTAAAGAGHRNTAFRPCSACPRSAIELPG